MFFPPQAGKLSLSWKRFLGVYLWQKVPQRVTLMPDCISSQRYESNVRVTGSIWESIFLLQAPQTDRADRAGLLSMFVHKFYYNAAPPSSLTYRGGDEMPSWSSGIHSHMLQTHTSICMNWIDWGRQAGAAASKKVLSLILFIINSQFRFSLYACVGSSGLTCHAHRQEGIVFLSLSALRWTSDLSTVCPATCPMSVGKGFNHPVTHWRISSRRWMKQWIDQYMCLLQEPLQDSSFRLWPMLLIHLQLTWLEWLPEKIQSNAHILNSLCTVDHSKCMWLDWR